MRNFLIRALVAVIAIPALLWIFHAGGGWLAGLVTLLSLIGVYEAWQVAQLRGFPLSLWMTALLALAAPWLVIRTEQLPWPAWLVLSLLACALWVVWRRDPVNAMQTALLQMIAVVWIGVGFGALIGLRQIPDAMGFRWLVLLFTTLWVGDTVAYLAGSAIGGRKLSPVISPNKTVAGAVAQILASASIGAIFALTHWIDAPFLLILTGATVTGTVGQVGDLFESVFKRAAGVKDFSAIIPGHGGVLDRFDSTLFAAPALWSLLELWPR